MPFGTWVSSLHPRAGGRFIRTNFGAPAKKAAKALKRTGAAARQAGGRAGRATGRLTRQAGTGIRRGGARVGAGGRRFGAGAASPFRRATQSAAKMRARRRAQAADWAIGYAQTPEELLVARAAQDARESATVAKAAKKAARAAKKTAPPRARPPRRPTPGGGARLAGGRRVLPAPAPRKAAIPPVKKAAPVKRITKTIRRAPRKAVKRVSKRVGRRA